MKIATKISAMRPRMTDPVYAAGYASARSTAMALAIDCEDKHRQALDALQDLLAFAEELLEHSSDVLGYETTRSEDATLEQARKVIAESDGL